MAPNISIRQSIRWLPSPASEPTSTVVLTSASNLFVDIRILKPAEGLPPHRKNEAVMHTDQLDWAFAGTSSSELLAGTNGQHVLHSTWRHWVDSRTTEPENATDEGDMFPQPDGTVLEKGRMVNPATGHLTDYEEVWQDEEPIAISSLGETGRRCIALQIHDEERQSRGLVVRVGQFCQGVWRVGDSLTLERWEWGEREGWKRTVRMGDGWLPCGVVLEGERVKLGGEVRLGEFVWKVVELGEF